ncbi:MAG: GTPase domain-containing protein [Planctomycetota bacterium]
MKTLLSQFCSEFGAAVEPLVGPLRNFCDVLQAAEDAGVVGLEAKPYVAGFHDVSHQLSVLVDKVAQQQAYVLIFGPLKSGKSTLMNSISAAYVSEVTALPAYPCMVYVSHAPQREFVVTRYNGDTNTFTSPASMRMQVSRDHAELADRIRREEDAGRDFDPALHFPEAIRRIDVRVPAEELRTSGAVLVDTPGLYSKMKFGYDRMTREFRNTAACAIFVVKTDNLFLEQVFAEFSELLELFSRIFLVVNLDTTKMDLRPDGSLSPSLEREDPVRIIEAFETLAMSASLKQAVDEGRLKIYPTDLLRAASQRLQESVSGSPTPAPAVDFRSFLQDLTDYLNSTDYLVAFLGDSLRHGGALVDEARGLCKHEGLRRLADDAERLKRERTRLVAELDATNKLLETDWKACFAPLADRVVDASEAEAASLRRTALKGVRGAVDGWMATDDSLKTLLDEGVAQVLAGYQRDFAAACETKLRSSVEGPFGGASIPDTTARELERAGIDLARFSPEGLLTILPREYTEQVALRIDVEAMPVRKTMLDWVLFRSRAGIRRRLVGNASNPANAIPRGEKQRRFDDATLDFVEDEILERLEGFFDGARTRIAQGMARDYSRTVASALQRTLDTRRQAQQKDLARVASQLGRLEELSEGLRTLEHVLESTARDVAALNETYVHTDPGELRTAFESESLSIGEIEPQPRRALPSPENEEPAETPDAFEIEEIE